MWLYVLCMGVAAFFYQFFITKAYSYVHPTKISSVSYLAVVFGGISDWLFWKNIVGLWTLLGIVLVVGGGLCALLDKKEPIKIGKRKF